MGYSKFTRIHERRKPVYNHRLLRRSPEIPASDGSVMGTAGPAVYPSVRKYMFGLSLPFNQ